VILGLLAPALLVGIAWTGMLAERRGEFGVMLAIGMPRRDLLITILLEALAAVLAGALVGVIVAYGTIVLLERSLGFVLSARAIPFVMPSAPECFTLGATSILLVAAAGLTGACIAAWMAARREPWALIRGDAA
jgi:putative ABC transport system permease protein